MVTLLILTMLTELKSFQVPLMLECPLSKRRHGMIEPLPFHPVYDHTYGGVMRASEDGLQRLGLDWIDILLAHDIGAFQYDDSNFKHFRDFPESGYKAMAELRAEGCEKAIGLGANENEVCLDALAIGQCYEFLLAGRYMFLEQTPLDELFPACERAETTMICGGLFNSGILSGRKMWNHDAAPRSVIKKVRALAEVAKEFGIPLHAAAL